MVLIVDTTIERDQNICDWSENQAKKGWAKFRVSIILQIYFHKNKYSDNIFLLKKFSSLKSTFNLLPVCFLILLR